jgi:hypothetical protein
LKYDSFKPFNTEITAKFDENDYKLGREITDYLEKITFEQKDVNIGNLYFNDKKPSKGKNENFFNLKVEKDPSELLKCLEFLEATIANNYNEQHYLNINKEVLDLIKQKPITDDSRERLIVIYTNLCSQDINSPHYDVFFGCVLRRISLMVLPPTSSSLLFDAACFFATSSNDFKSKNRLICTLKGFLKMLKNFRKVSKDFKKASKKFREILKNYREVSKKFREILKNFREVLKNFKKVSENFRKISKNYKKVSKDFKKASKDFKKILKKVDEEDAEKCVGISKYIMLFYLSHTDPQVQMLAINILKIINPDYDYEINEKKEEEEVEKEEQKKEKMEKEKEKEKVEKEKKKEVEKKKEEVKKEQKERDK